MNDSIFELICSFIITIFFAVSIFRSIKTKAPVSIPRIAFWVAGMNIGLLPWASYLVNDEVFFYNTGYMTDSLYAVFIMFLLGLWVSTLNFRQQRIDSLRFVTESLSTNVKFSIIFNIFLIIYISRVIDSFVYGGGLSGLGTAEYQSSKPYIFVILKSLIVMFRTAILFWLFYHAERKVNLITGLIILEMIYTFFFFGRREMIFFVIFFFLVRYLKGRKLGIKQIISSIIAIMLVINFLFPAFLSFRDGYINSRYMGYSISEIFTMGLDNMVFSDEVEHDKYSSRISSRLSGTNHYIRELLSQQKYTSPMYGDAAFRYFSVAIPRFIYPDKPLVHPEDHVTYHYNIYSADPSSTMLSAGVADFGVVGGFIVGLFSGLMLRAGQWLGIAVISKSSLIGSVVFLNTFNIAVHYEATATTYFATLRDSIILVIFYFTISYFYKKKKVRRIHTSNI